MKYEDNEGPLTKHLNVALGWKNALLFRKTNTQPESGSNTGLFGRLQSVSAGLEVVREQNNCHKQQAICLVVLMRLLIRAKALRFENPRRILHSDTPRTT